MNQKKFLFACMPFEGHFHPLTGLAVHLQQQGHDVRWYTGGSYREKVAKLGIPFYSFENAIEVNQDNMDEVFPDRKNHKGTLAKLKFDIKYGFLARVPEFVVDIDNIHRNFAFDALVSDCVFCASPIIRQRYGVPSIVIGVLPLTETSRDLPPAGLGMTPSNSFFGRRKQDILRWVNKNVIFKEATAYANQIMTDHGVKPFECSLFDALVQDADIYLQSGTPGFEYRRSDLSPNVRFVGPLLPYSAGPKRSFDFGDKLNQYRKIILATQGTVERDPEKILVPTLEAFKDSDTLVIVTTGGSRTEQLRARYPQSNLIIEDFIDFRQIMPYADAYVTNAGYGGVMLSIQNHLPMVVAGIHEGKNEIAARVGYFDLGINLKTETPTSKQIRESVEKILKDPRYKKNVVNLSNEFARYDPNHLSEQYIMEVLSNRKASSKEIAALAA